MRVIEKRLNEIRPYDKNPRKNEKAVPAVAESIRRFGWKVPLVIDRDGVIVAGHTRYKAAKKLGLSSAPCVVAEDLSPEEVKAFRVVDNRVSELAEWDFELLDGELSGLSEMNFSLEDLGFDFKWDGDALGIGQPDPRKDPMPGTDTGSATQAAQYEPKSEERFLHMELFTSEGVGEYGIPAIFPEKYEPRPLIPFSDAAAFKGDPAGYGLHFFLDDYRFERVWNSPQQYLQQLEKFSYVLSPDFSLYIDTPKAVQIWNHYRKHWVGAFWQSRGIKVFPTICWSDESSFAWCFDGEPKEAPVFVSSVGVRKHEDSMKLFLAGYEAMKKKLRPTKILHYGKPISEIAAEVEEIEAFQAKFDKEK